MIMGEAVIALRYLQKDLAFTDKLKLFVGHLYRSAAPC